MMRQMTPGLTRLLGIFVVALIVGVIGVAISFVAWPRVGYTIAVVAGLVGGAALLIYIVAVAWALVRRAG